MEGRFELSRARISSSAYEHVSIVQEFFFDEYGMKKRTFTRQTLSQSLSRMGQEEGTFNPRVDGRSQGRVRAGGSNNGQQSTTWNPIPDCKRLQKEQWPFICTFMPIGTQKTAPRPPPPSPDTCFLPTILVAPEQSLRYQPAGLLPDMNLALIDRSSLRPGAVMCCSTQPRADGSSWTLLTSFDDSSALWTATEESSLIQYELAGSSPI